MLSADYDKCNLQSARCWVDIYKALKLVGVVKLNEMDNLEIRAVIKYLVKKGLQPRQIYDDMLLTLEANAPSYSTVKKWAAVFKLRRISVEDDPHSGRPNEGVTTKMSRESTSSCLMIDV